MSLIDDDARSEIRTSTSASLFVDAGAGSGKTTALVDRVASSVLDDGVPLAATAVVTFTEKAGSELRDRLRARFEDAVRDADDSGDRARAEAARTALDDLDAAAIGTLHSFAQRILAAFPIQAGMPPLVEALDEVGSSVAFDARWSETWRRMLDDDTLAEPLLLALGAGVTVDHLRSLARAFGNDWDLIDSHVLSEPPRPFAVPTTDALERQALLLVERSVECTVGDDRFLDVLREVEALCGRIRSAAGHGERHEHVTSLAAKKGGNKGRAGNWADIKGLRAQLVELTDAAAELAARMSEVALRPLARAIAVEVREAARERIASGRLEFHDLLVAARDLLRRDAGARDALQETYRRLLLDEFQDTDPIQIELAVRIAGGADATADRWQDVVVPDGSIFVVGDPKQSIYRFRRASIETYLDAGGRLGRRVSLTTNFRTISPVLDWVNTVFAEVIQEDPGRQPAYQPLVAHRLVDDVEGLIGPPVAVLGADLGEKGSSAAQLRQAEATEVAAAIVTALDDGWTVFDERAKAWRPIRSSDIAILIPSRTSLPVLEEALEAAGVAYRAESSSLVYQSDEIRALLAAARAIADPSDELACVTALRSRLFACGDDDLFRHKQGGGRFSVTSEVPEALVEAPVGAALTYLRRLQRASRWASPAELLTSLAVDRRMLEAATATAKPSAARDEWGRIRFVIDQARAWSDVEHGGLREYLAWASHQAQDAARVAEALLPETDLDVVRIMTIHAAKGLEFGMVVMSGMSSQPRSPGGVRLLWTAEGGYAVSLSKAMQTHDFAEAAPLDEQMDGAERRRLLYVAATRARDHLVVSLHRTDGGGQSNAKVLVEAGALDAGAVPLARRDLSPRSSASRAIVAPPPAHEPWLAGVVEARAASRRAASRSASGLEGNEPEVRWQLADASADAALAERIAGLAKGARDTELPAWVKGRYGSAIGRAVHATLQIVDGDAARVGNVAESQAVAEGVADLEPVVAAHVRSALLTPVVQRAFASEHWSEVFVGTVEADGVILEGFVDLLFRGADGALTIVDYKTDRVVDRGSLEARASHYAPQLRAYATALEAATGERPRASLVFVDASGTPGIEVAVETA